MRSTFFGLNIGLKALQAQQRALDVTGHNIANANTPGYTRQDVIMEASLPVRELNGWVGTGVEIGEFRRIRDEFLDIQLRTENKSLGEWEIKADLFGKLEVIINEPSESGLRMVMDDYWESWQDLSKDPESAAVRETVVQRGLMLVEAFGHVDRQLNELQADINKGIAIRVDEINSIARQVADLNFQIIKAEADGSKANDLRDKRDLLVEQLSKIINMDLTEDQLGSVTITIGGKTLVSRTYVTEMKFTDHEFEPTAAVLEWVDPLTGASQGLVRVNGGIVNGYLEMRDKFVAKFQEDISSLAKAIAEEVNAVHNSGYGLDDNPGLDFFVKIDDESPFGSGNISVNPLLVEDTTLLAAGKSTPVVKGDGANALEISQLRYAMVMNAGTATLEDFYRSMVARLGVNAQEAERMTENQTLLTEQLLNKREAVSGVSLDEEMTNMIRFQHSYNAAAKVITVMDEMLDTIINRLGMIGR